MKFVGWPWFAAGVRTLAPIPLTSTAIALVVILWRGGWPEDTSPARIQWLGIALIANILLLGLALFLTGGIRNFSLKAGVIEASVNDDGKVVVEAPADSTIEIKDGDR